MQLKERYRTYLQMHHLGDLLAKMYQVRSSQAIVIRLSKDAKGFWQSQVSIENDKKPIEHTTKIHTLYPPK